jgi:phosphoglycerol transferase MdoB-like AlkP superfamily enzyme
MTDSRLVKRKTAALLFGLLMFKFLWFDGLWCAESTFRPFSAIETYVFAALASLLLLIPYILINKVFIAFIVDIMLGMLLECNLLYFRTYYTAIPLTSYAIAGNLKDFTSSIYGSMHLGDVMFAGSTIVALLLLNVRRATGTALLRTKQYLLLLAVTVLIAATLLLVKGGFRKSYEALQDSYTHTCGTPMFTVFGSIYYDYIRDTDVFTPEIGERIRKFEMQSADTSAVYCPFSPQNVIIILAESFESWVLQQTVENQEITPRLNKLLNDGTTFYAPYVLSQVKGGRSIDAQLILNTGLLPVNNGVYSIKYPYSIYPSLAKAMRQKYNADFKSFVLTADKPIVWNQNIIATQFGYDTLISKADFRQDEKIGPHYRKQLGDMSLLRQCADKILNHQTWLRNGVNLLQIVTYSGHFPFALPEHLRQVHFSDAMPTILRDYLTVANYTDRAICEFIDALRHEPFFDNTLIIITGDHEGLANHRAELCETPQGKGLVSDKPFVPFIVVAGSKIPKWKFLHYPFVLGQIDIYPTLLDFLGLNDYEWKGLGKSVFNPAKPPVAINPHGLIIGDTVGVPQERLRYLKDAWQISDDIIRYNWFENR